MRYDTRLHRKGRASRRGIAVMFALGILSLVIVAVLIFSRRAVTDRKVAAANVSYTGAKDLAMSAFGRAVLQLQKHAAIGNMFYSGNVGDNDVDWLWKMDPAGHYLGADCPIRWQYVHDDKGHIIGRYAYFIAGGDRLKLNAMLDHSFCKAGAACDGGDGCPYENRYGNSAAELRIDYRKFSSTINETINSLLLRGYKDKGGKVLQYESPELFVFSRGYTPKTGTGKTYGDVMRVINQWLNISLSSALNEPDAWFGGDGCNDGTAANGIKDKSEFFQRLPIRQIDWNAVANKSGGGDAAVNEILQSGATSFYDASGKPVATNTAGIPWLKHWNDTDRNNGNWANGATKGKQIAANIINYCASGDSPVVSDQSPILPDNESKKEDIETWGINKSTRQFVVPSYTGNKRTWYLNECRVRMQVDFEKGAAKKHEYKEGGVTAAEWYSFGDGSSKNKLRITLYVEPEIINMYGSDVLEGTYTVEGYLDYELEYPKNMRYVEKDGGKTFENVAATEYEKYTEFNGSTQHQTLGRQPSSTSCIPDTTADNYKTFYFSKEEGKHYIAVREHSIPGSFAFSSDAPTQEQIAALKLFIIKNIKIRNFRLMVRRVWGSKKELVDYAHLRDIDVPGPKELPADHNDENLELNVSLAVSDPRHNLHQEDWVTLSTDTLGAANSGSGITVPTGAAWNASTGWNKDLETVTGPADGLSTAYIRHGTMESLWELGAIHRAAPWQTLNFKRPNNSSLTEAQRLTENLKTKGGGAYGEGDFPLLDQVTMQGGTDYKPVAQFGRINLNMPAGRNRRFNFHALFLNIPWSAAGKYDLSGTKYTLNDTRTITVEDHLVKYLESAPDGIRLFRRSDIFRTPETTENNFWNLLEKSPYSGSTMTDSTGEKKELFKDALHEQLICRIIGLTEANTMPDSAVVVVLAQTIQDLGGGVKVYKDWNLNKKFDASNTISETNSQTKLVGLHAGYYYQEPNKNAGTFKNPGFFTERIPSSIKDEIEAQYGRYDNGADRITGETLMQAQLQYDREQGKWKIVQVKYEE